MTFPLRCFGGARADLPTRAESTPLGTILNRFSRDIYVIDEVLARVFGGFFRTMASVFGMIAVITSQAPAFLFVLVPVLFVYKQVQS